MKAHITMMTLLAGVLAFTPAPVLSADSPIVAKGRMTSRDMAGVSRTFTIDQSGVLRADIDDQGVKSDLEIRPHDGTIEISRHMPWGTEITLIDVARTSTFSNTNSAISKALQQVQAQATGTRFFTSYEYRQTGAASCGGELNDLLQAADRAVSVCSMGGGIMCVLATSEYYHARDRYNACLQREEGQIDP